ncbi:MAG: HEPN domain-containing protein [Ferruginibacter sp.]|nr:HEPN domain-containing protein [Ferruginibacter sp.]
MKEYEKWFKKAESDLLTIKLIITAKDAPFEICCFHAQQAAEKYLKAFLTAHNIQFLKTHQLFLLVKICASKNSVFLEILPNAKKIEIYGVSSSYSDDIDDLTFEDAKEAYANAIAIKDFVITHFFD